MKKICILLIVLLLVSMAFFYDLVLAHCGFSRFQLKMASKYGQRDELQNLSKSLYWIRRAAANGRTEGYEWLADIYSAPDIYSPNLYPVEKDLKTAAANYEKAARKGSQMAMVKLGLLHTYGCSPLKRKPEEEISPEHRDFKSGYLWLSIAEKRAKKTGEKLHRNISSAIKACEDNLSDAEKKMLKDTADQTESEIAIWHGEFWGK
jgi:TPR repeat protein